MAQRLGLAEAFGDPGFSHHGFDHLPFVRASPRPQATLFAYAVHREKRDQRARHGDGSIYLPLPLLEGLEDDRLVGSVDTVGRQSQHLRYARTCERQSELLLGR